LLNVLLWYWGRRGGGCAYTLEMARALKKQNINLYLSLSKDSELYHDFDGLGICCFDVNTYSNIYTFAKSFARLKKIRKEFWQFIIDNSIDIVYSPMHHVWGGYIASILSEYNIPYVLTVHDAFIHPGDRPFIHQTLLDANIKCATSAICLTNTVRNSLISRKFSNIYEVNVIPHGVFSYYKAFNPRSISDVQNPRILFFGRISRYKGLSILLDAWPKILEQIPSSTLEIWGEGDASSLLHIINSYHSIKFVNRWSTNEEISMLFRDCDLCVLPYIEASQSGVIAIALAAGMPVVITPLSGLIEQISYGGGVIADNMSSSGLTVAIVSILTNSELYHQQSLLALKAADRFNWNTIGMSTASFLEKTFHDKLPKKK
jgi:glycosyltransferase involved in cell wall biosynthesis